jgi:hypothetical protein
MGKQTEKQEQLIRVSWTRVSEYIVESNVGPGGGENVQDKRGPKEGVSNRDEAVNFQKVS